MQTRKIQRIVTGQQAIDGAGVLLVRVLGYRTVKDFDPFLMLDAFDSQNPDDYIRGFPMHPHRGIETVTYLVEGEIEHQDSLGHKGVIRSGDSQWMAAGSGILHQEMPAASPRMLGLQLWINLPQKEKMTDPKYRNITADMIPVVREAESEVRVLSGEYAGTRGAVLPDYVQARFLDVTIQPGVEWSAGVDPRETVFAYVLRGAGLTGPAMEAVDHKQAVLLTAGDAVTFTAGPEGLRVIFLSAPPLREAVAWGGPIVMNTDDELRTAFFELEDNTFIKHEAAAT